MNETDDILETSFSNVSYWKDTFEFIDPNLIDVYS